MVMDNIRDSTHPAFPSLVRARVQSSILTGTGGAAGGASLGFTSSISTRLVLDSSSQLAGGLMDGGGGGGGSAGSFFADFFFLGGAAFFTGGGGAAIGATRGAI